MTTELVPSTVDDTLAEIEHAIERDGNCTPEQAMTLLRLAKATAPRRQPDAWATIQRGQVVDATLHKPRAPGDSCWEFYQARAFSAPQPLYMGFPGVGACLSRAMLERRRQVAQEGYDAEHDDIYRDGQLLRAAAVYLLRAAGIARLRTLPFWPWSRQWLKDDDEQRCIDKGAALLFAEMDRRDRSESSAP